MIVLRDDKRIARLRRISQYTSLLGMLALVGGLVIAFWNPEEFFVYELVALLAGWILSQVGVFLGHRYIRNPRPDEVLDKELRRVFKDGRLYHYLLPAPHVLLTPQGIILFVTKFQGGKISVNGDKWSQRGVGLRKFFGGESLGNPTKEAESAVSGVANYLRQNAPEVEEVLMAPIIVFTGKGTQELEIGETSVPAMHYTKLRGFLRQQRGRQSQPTLSAADYRAIRAAFDKKASHLMETPVDAGEEDE